MNYNVIGTNVTRLDAKAKVTGKAKYADDYFERDMLIGKVLRSPYAHAIIKRIDVSKALEIQGVEAVLTHKDVPKVKFATAGHPWTFDEAHRDVEDRYIITDKVRFWGEPVAAVVAVDELTALKALKLIEVEYEELPFVLSQEEALKEGAPIIHEERPDNIISSFGNGVGDIEKELETSDMVYEGEFVTSIVQHCHIENHSAYAYMDENERLVIVTSTQIPHIVKTIVGQALKMPVGKIRVIKPFIGGGFGNKQDVVIEPLTAAMCLAVNGRAVRYALTREEVFIDTRVRHAMKFNFKVGVSKEGFLKGIDINNLVNNGAYASHGHSVTMSCGSKFRPLYDFKAIRYAPKTIYTNIATAGAMRGYGVPQITFALESQLDDIALDLNIDPTELRLKNLVKQGHFDPSSKNIVRAMGLAECIEKGKKLIKWDEKREKYKSQQGFLRRGIGMACFSYFSGTHPVALEAAGARIVMNQDGSVQLQIGATEIGQGSDTVFAQMTAEVLGIPVSMINVVTNQDTDITPFDTGAYASRQTFISGAAVKKAALEVKNKVLQFASRKNGLSIEAMDIVDSKIIEIRTGIEVCSLLQIALESYYDRIYSCPITSDTSVNMRVNSVAYGVTFADIEVDMKLGTIEVKEIYNVHDSGIIMNPMLAEGQVHGGVSMSLGYALSEEMRYDEKTGKLLNGNLLDYKLQTIMDTPLIGSAFVEIPDDAGSFGQKSLGENTTLSPAPAIRNALLNATGVKFNTLPMNPQRVYEKFKLEGLV